MDVHSWWTSFGDTTGDLTGFPSYARALADLLADGLPGASLIEARATADESLFGLRIDVEVERPQLLEHDIRGIEPIAVIFSKDGDQPCIAALRPDFPDTPHQNEKPEGLPCMLCVDDRPWAEAKLTWTPADLVRRIQTWLAKAARGELHDTGRPLEPIFFRAPRTIVLSRSALSIATLPPELVGFVHEDQRVILARPIAELAGIPDMGRLMVLVYRVEPQPMMRMRHAPRTLSSLAAEMQQCGTDLIADLQARTIEWAGLEKDDLRRLSSSLAIVVLFPISRDGGEPFDDVRAFVTQQTAGEIGVALGQLLPNTSGKGAKTGYLRALPPAQPHIEGLGLEPTDVQIAFDRELAASAAGCAPDRRRAVLVGAGALGSQLALDLAREGAFEWSVVDSDRLMPHNLARHGLSAGYVGMPKAVALARQIEELLGEPTNAIVTDITAPYEDVRPRLEEALLSADIIIDASASVAAARHISDLPSTARRVSAFFNPAGTALVLLTESADRSVSLRDLEAQYHRLVQTEPDLEEHLRVEQSGLRYSGSCRALSNRIPATRAAMLSAIAAIGIRESTAQDNGSIRIWRLSSDGEIRLSRHEPRPVRQKQVGSWMLSYDDGLLDQLTAMRQAGLPNETGGVLLGIADMSRKSIHVVNALPPPADSVGSATGFERGVAGLTDTVNAAITASLHQLRYVGEWHSHPPRSTAMPSSTDLRQLAWLRHELEAEGLPALMAIAADDGRFSFVVAVAANDIAEVPQLKVSGEGA
ncbi:JAB domain-containing protein [Filomicrobium insigne]|uniref:JAB domain-containing protein n=1 Tax=Filomicrobium insigne TaxID=418854 RepID=A0A1H0N297_9HYPH|nr:ThiF family adenylyltransferase [Filomicrobium insigne]SDO86751.1 JAB domain-containing protein [Filomicrobium insigne]